LQTAAYRKLRYPKQPTIRLPISIPSNTAYR
jgi:hypothetical protein